MDHKQTKESSQAVVYSVRRFTRKHVYSVIAVFVVLASVVSGVLIWRSLDNGRPAVVSSVCGESITTVAGQQSVTQDVRGFEQLAQQIKALKNYEHDPNCLYILAQSSILLDDLIAAHTIIAQLKEDYATFVFDKYLDDGKASIRTLEGHYSLKKEALDNENGVIDPAI